MTATCDCKFNDIANNNLIKDNEMLSSAFGEVLDLINSSNILVFKCMKNMFTHFSRSIGAWISLASICIHIGMTLSFFLLSFTKVNQYLFSLTYNYLSYLKNSAKNMINYPPKKIIKNTRKEKVLIQNINSDNKLMSKKNKLPPILSTIPVEKKEVSHIENKITIKDTDNINMEVSENAKESKKNIIIDEQKYDKKFFEEYLSTSLDDLEFDDAVAKDHRKYCEHMKENLIEDQIIANTFIAEDPLKPRTIKIILLILNIVLYFVINGLFFSEEVISELYNIDEEKKIFLVFFLDQLQELFIVLLQV